MNSLVVKEELFDEPVPALEAISTRLDRLGKGLPIGVINWEKFDYLPEVRFNISYCRDEIFLKYYVKEKYFKAEKTETNQMVCEDSCVEFFISPEEDGIYYNIEFNAIGTCMMGSGTSRSDIERAPAEIISKIRKLTTRSGDPEKEISGNIEWALTLAIPSGVFFRHSIDRLKGRSLRANFYKCGDKLTMPHYLTWNRVETEVPDFHRPEFFGELLFR